MLHSFEEKKAVAPVCGTKRQLLKGPGRQHLGFPAGVVVLCGIKHRQWSWGMTRVGLCSVSLSLAYRSVPLEVLHPKPNPTLSVTGWALSGSSSSSWSQLALGSSKAFHMIPGKNTDSFMIGSLWGQRNQERIEKGRDQQAEPVPGYGMSTLLSTLAHSTEPGS